MLTAIWFAFYTLIGPGVCCCTLRANAAEITTSQSPSKTPRKSCCGEVTEEQRSGASDRPQHRCPPRECPCRQTKDAAQPAIKANGQFPANDSVRFSSFDSLDPFTSPDSFAASVLADRSDQRLSPHPFLTADILLNTFHRLRC